MLPLPVTICITAIFALMLTGLSVLVSLRRKDLKVLSGDGDDAILHRRMRAHGNFIENAPLAILLVLALEAVLATSETIWLVALVLIISRLLHAIGTLRIAPSAAIVAGMAMQHLTFIVCAIWLLVQTLSNVLQSA
ncbi:MAPEG family protein [Thalassospira sp. MA62]|nr:MAPEG family protein [Thalassospira sp. MA62]